MSTMSDDNASYDEEIQSMVALHDCVVDERFLDNIHTTSNLFNNDTLYSFPRQEMLTDIDGPISHREYQETRIRGSNLTLCHIGTHFDLTVQVRDNVVYPPTLEARDLYSTDPADLVAASFQGKHINDPHLTTPYTGAVHGYHVVDKHEIDVFDIPSNQTASFSTVESSKPTNFGISLHHFTHTQARATSIVSGNDKASIDYTPSIFAATSSELASITSTPSALSNRSSPGQEQNALSTPPGKKSHTIQNSPSDISASPYNYSESKISPSSGTPSTSHGVITPQSSPNTAVYTPPKILLSRSPLCTSYGSNQTQLYRWLYETRDNNMPVSTP